MVKNNRTLHPVTYLAFVPVKKEKYNNNHQLVIIFVA